MPAMRGWTSTAEVSCPACGAPIVVSLAFDPVDPEPGALAAPFDVSIVDAGRVAETHAEVCSAGGGC